MSIHYFWRSSFFFANFHPCFVRCCQKSNYQQFGDNVQTILLFGSRARGEAAPDSDMDLLVVVSDASPDIVRAIRYLAVDVWLKYDIYLSTRVWSQKHWQQLGNLQTLLYRNILRDGVPL
jgi:predicted nucleotidyltransferase